MNESVIDFPKATLCPEIWEKVVDQNGMNEVWKLIPEVKAKIMNFIQKLADLAKLQFPNEVHITGSITSNSYTENADIDIHILKYSIREPARITQSRFVEAIKIMRETDKESTYIGTHPFEVYYQDNEFQDYMSVGCYDFLKDEWLVGPELIDQSFNPYSEYYKEVQEKSESMANNIRNTIFSIYETAIILKKNINTDFGNNIRSVFVSKLEEAKTLYENIRQMRKVYSSPESIEQALKYRSSRKWKIADASFKLFDKYGYMAILKQFVESYDLIQNTQDIDIEVIENILSTVKQYINNADKLAEQEIYEDTQMNNNEQINEGKISSMLLATLLAIPGILPAKQVQKSIDTQPTYAYIVNDINAKCRKIGQYTAFQAANIIARTLFAEARNDGVEGMTAVASVIYNRANGKISDFANVCKKNGYSKKHKKIIHQFSCWNKMTNNEWLPKNFQVKLPKAVKTGSNEQKLWEQAMLIVSEMLAGSFTPITKANMYYNPEKAKPNWRNQLKNTEYYGKHKFGYLKNHSPFV